MPNVYKIQLHERVKPFSSATPCRPPLPMTEKVQAERKGMQREDIIRSVTNPMDWYAPIVVMPKSSCSVPISMNPIKLNKIVRLENVPLPKTVQLQAQLSWATIFSKLDCNSRFYTDEWAFTGTLSICHSVHVLLLQMNYFLRINTRPEIFRREIDDILTEIPGVVCETDGVLFSGKIQKGTWCQTKNSTSATAKRPESHQTRSASLQHTLKCLFHARDNDRFRQRRNNHQSPEIRKRLRVAALAWTAVRCVTQ